MQQSQLPQVDQDIPRDTEVAKERKETPANADDGTEDKKRIPSGDQVPGEPTPVLHPYFRIFDRVRVAHSDVAIVTGNDRILYLEYVSRSQAVDILTTYWAIESKAKRTSIEDSKMLYKDRTKAVYNKINALGPINYNYLGGYIKNIVTYPENYYYAGPNTLNQHTFQQIEYGEEGGLKKILVPGHIPMLDLQCVACLRYAPAQCPGNEGQFSKCLARFCTPVCEKIHRDLHDRGCKK